MMENGPRVFEVDKTDLNHSRVFHVEERPLQDGEVRLLIDEFALTANNITYGVFGEAMGYWKFFPAEDSDWGRIPVWGFATVIESLHEDIDPGDRFFGYFPMGTELIVKPDDVREGGFLDSSSHRQGLPLFYNRYVSVSGDPGYRADYEHQQMLFRPLFLTAFLIDDQLAEFAFHGASQVILSSASSKTALALAWHLSQRGIETIGLTSKRSRPFVKNSGVYDKIFLYDELENELDIKASVYVDFAGNPELMSRIHHALHDHLKASVRVGAADWKSGQTAGDQASLPGPEPTFFFAPDQGNKRSEEWGAKEFNQRVTDSMLAFYEPASRWIKSVRGMGDEAIHECYERVLKGEALPSEGFILSFGI